VNVISYRRTEKIATPETVRTQLEKSAQRVYKGKAIPLEDWTGPEVSRRFGLTDFKKIGK
jgi:hypothetical protein